MSRAGYVVRVELTDGTVMRFGGPRGGLCGADHPAGRAFTFKVAAGALAEMTSTGDVTFPFSYGDGQPVRLQQDEVALIGVERVMLRAPVDVDAVIAALRTEAQSERDEGALSAYGYAVDLLTGKALP